MFKSSTNLIRTSTHSWKWWFSVPLETYVKSSCSNPPQTLYEPPLILENDDCLCRLTHRLNHHFQNLHKHYTHLHSFLKIMMFFTAWNIIKTPFSKSPQTLYEPPLIPENDDFLYRLKYWLNHHFQNLHKPYTNLHSLLKMPISCTAWNIG